ncbi:MAG: carbon monoxide dehydrogenase small chain [Pseudomonadota bacterium]
MPTVRMAVNGQVIERELEARRLLVDFLRIDLGLTGTHVGCDTSQCGACTVHVDGIATKSCTMLALQADGREVTTIEGMARPDGSLHPIQQAFIDCHGLQCGYCTPGMIMTSACLLSEHPTPDDAAIEEALQGNLCRCTGYVNIVEAVRVAAAAMRDR